MMKQTYGDCRFLWGRVDNYFHLHIYPSHILKEIKVYIYSRGLLIPEVQESTEHESKGSKGLSFPANRELAQTVACRTGDESQRPWCRTLLQDFLILFFCFLVIL